MTFNYIVHTTIEGKDTVIANTLSTYDAIKLLQFYTEGYVLDLNNKVIFTKE